MAPADPGALLNIGSGVLIALLGGALLWADPRKDWNRVFALFSLFWGAQIVSANAVRLADTPEAARLAGEVTLAFLIPLYFFLAAFAAIFPRPRGPLGASGGRLALLAVPAAVALAALFAAPDTLVAAVEPQPGGGFGLRWGPLLPYLVTAPFYGALFYALHVMTQRLAGAASPTERTQVALVLAALALFAGYVTPVQLVRFGGAALGVLPAEADLGEAAVIAAIMAVGLLLLARLAAVLVRAARAEGPGGRDARVVLAALGAGVGSAALVEALALGGLALEALGLVRAGSVALIGYGIARYQLFDIDLRVKDLGPAVAAALAVTTLAAAAWLALPSAALAADWRGVVVAVVALAAFLPLLRLFGRVAERVAPHVSREGDHLYLRKLEVYRAAVEAGLREGRPAAADDPELAEQRRRLGLGERDHGIVVSLAVSRAEPAGAAPDLRPGGVVFGKYVIDSLLAEGGFGRVFLARDRVLARPVVVKELQAKWRGNPNVVRTFLREAQIAGALSHPNIVAVHEVEQHGQDHYIVMEYLPGGSLAERLRSGPLAPAEAVRVAREVLAALEAAHGRGVVHRDVKPENILFGARGEVKLADFGIAQLADEDVQRTIGGLTTGRFHPGTLQYMSPEQARGRPVDARSDVYATGAVLHLMLSGRPHLALDGLDELAARTAIASAPPAAPLPGLPAALNAALAKALATRPEDRFAGAGEFRAALEAVRLPARPA